MNNLKKIVNQYLGRGIQCAKVYADVLVVDTGVKPAYLYDAGRPDSGNLSHFLHQLRFHGYIENPGLKVIEIGMDCLVVNVEVLKAILSKTDEDDYIFVNVSKQCKKPCILQDKEVKRKLFSELRALVTNLESCDCVFSIDIDETCNVSSMFGLLLNYPVIYWYDCSGENAGDNCLALEPLTVIQVNARLVHVKLGGGDLSEVFGASFHHTLYQFSYPTQLGAICEPLVEKWVECLKAKFCSSNVFSDVKVKNKHQTLNAVML